MPPPRTLILTILAMLAFASNSLLCRMALKHTNIDAASFTSIRLISGALVLWLIVRLRGETIAKAGSWFASLALISYAACFAIAYVSLSAGTGALLLFGSVQITMISYGLWMGERLRWSQSMGLILALAGLIGLLLPGVTTPPLPSSLLMLCAGMSWGIYSLLGKGVANPTQVTASNFLRAVPFAIALSLFTYPQITLDLTGVGYAIAAGAIASGMGYAIWYHALPGLQVTQAAVVQLSVPILAALVAIPLLQEPMTLRLGLAAITVLGGIALVIGQRQRAGQIPANASEFVKNQSRDRRFLTLSLPIRQRLVWSLWLMTWLGLLAGLISRQWYEGVVWFSAVHALLFIYLERFNLTAFPVQVRLAYVAWVAIGTYIPYMHWLMWITTVALATNLFMSYCPLARLLSLLPLNRSEPLSFNLVSRVFLSPPMKGRFIPQQRGFKPE
ncbi:DMT family transporter [Nostoc sp. LEGE 12447]|uniref:DMT family transporter n=1 Tax=Nostoc sp. LEGE 12447 TaxID=1828640 RepID=UPI001883BD46|nr:DMT family transporter [Nostoc sp. LEGE 12447]MBE9001389.1 DMT family transporter [Nostoc sp. LEGE 12447]